MGSVLEAFVRLCSVVFTGKKYVGRGWPEATKDCRKARVRQYVLHLS